MQSTGYKLYTNHTTSQPGCHTTTLTYINKDMKHIMPDRETHTEGSHAPLIHFSSQRHCWIRTQRRWCQGQPEGRTGG